MIRKHQRFFNTLLVTLDVSTLLIAYFCAIMAKQFTGGLVGYDDKYIWATLWIVPVYLMAYYFMGVYSPMRVRSYRKEVLIVTRAHLVGTLILFSLLFVNKQLEFSREVSFIYAVSGFLLILIGRYVIRRTLRYFRQIGYNQKYMLIIGAGHVGVEFAQKIIRHGDFGYNIVGYLDDNAEKIGLTIAGKPVIGGTGFMPALFEKQTVDEVVVALPSADYEKSAAIVEECDNAGVRVRVISDYRNLHSGNPLIDDFDGIPLLNVRIIQLDDPFNKFIKRIFDVLISFIAIILTGSVMFFIAMAIKLTSPGPVFYRQVRVGLGNRPFNMLKFRTMHVATDSSDETTWTTSDDQRKTGFGTFLRKTSLDELPQFFNVLSGSMSVVGPRPERPFFVEQFKAKIPSYMVKHQVKPGITGWAQVNGWRGDTSIEKRIECDIYYIENWDLIFDIKIMFMTIFKGLFNKNAY
jgi:Undecaprenyl-phosphate glucose phosphotransferase